MHPNPLRGAMAMARMQAAAASGSPAAAGVSMVQGASRGIGLEFVTGDTNCLDQLKIQVIWGYKLREARTGRSKSRMGIGRKGPGIREGIWGEKRSREEKAIACSSSATLIEWAHMPASDYYSRRNR